jgi:hypothetical protein
MPVIPTTVSHIHHCADTYDAAFHQKVQREWDKDASAALCICTDFLHAAENFLVSWSNDPVFCVNFKLLAQT